MTTKNNYIINYEFSIPSEIMINDITVDIDLQEGAYGPEFINQYILDDGIQKVCIKLIQPRIKKRSSLTSSALEKICKGLQISLVHITNDYKVELVKKLSFPEIKEPVPFIEYEWEFDAELPFELEGWKNSEDLSKWDEKELEKQVKTKFTQLRNMLNEGDSMSFVKELEFANKEYFVADYVTKQEQQEYISNLLEQYGELKGLVPPVENYRLRIMGNGKAVALETLGKHKGQGILTTENKDENELYQLYVILHMPKGSKEFQIVRVNAQMTSID